MSFENWANRTHDYETTYLFVFGIALKRHRVVLFILANGMVIKVDAFMERYALDRKDWGWSLTLRTNIELGMTTKREIAIVSSLISMFKDRPGLKSRIQSERAKAKTDQLHPVILSLMARAEAGRALGG